jgi:vanillate O-demethylase monooxygenase subunit
VRIERWTENQPPPNSTLRPGSPALRDNYMTYDFLVPGVLLMYTGTFLPGTARSVEMKVPDYSAALTSSFTSQAVTPRTASTSRYFFSWGPALCDGAESLADAMLKIAHQAFHEDKVMIEAQYRTMQESPHPAEMPTTADKAVVMFQRMMRALMPATAEA